MIYSNRRTPNDIIAVHGNRTSLCRFLNMTLFLPPWFIVRFQPKRPMREIKELDLLEIYTNGAMDIDRFAFLMSFELCCCF